MLAAQEPTPAAGPDPCSRSPDWPGGLSLPPSVKWAGGSRSHEQHVAKLGTEGLLQLSICCVAVGIRPPGAWVPWRLSPSRVASVFLLYSLPCRECPPPGLGSWVGGAPLPSELTEHLRTDWPASGVSGGPETAHLPWGPPPEPHHLQTPGCHCWASWTGTHRTAFRREGLSPPGSGCPPAVDAVADL